MNIRALIGRPAAAKICRDGGRGPPYGVFMAPGGFLKQSFMGYPPVNYEKFLMRVPLTLNLEP
jgi:hypothetical protein